MCFSYFANLEVKPEVLQDDGEKRIQIVRKPLGVVAAITPWNFPVVLLSWKLAPALLAGNTVVAKPSEFTPISSLFVADILKDVLPAGVINVVSGPYCMIFLTLTANSSTHARVLTSKLI